MKAHSEHKRAINMMFIVTLLIHLTVACAATLPFPQQYFFLLKLLVSVFDVVESWITGCYILFCCHFTPFCSSSTLKHFSLGLLSMVLISLFSFHLEIFIYVPQSLLYHKSSDFHFSLTSMYFLVHYIHWLLPNAVVFSLESNQCVLADILA